MNLPSSVCYINNKDDHIYSKIETLRKLGLQSLSASYSLQFDMIFLLLFTKTHL